jgi:hypothetical protein
MEPLIASQTEQPESSHLVRFPSTDWFQEVVAQMGHRLPVFEHLGEVDCVAQFTVLDGRPGGVPWSVQLTFEEFAVPSVRETEGTEEADFVVEATLETWREMIENIARGGGRPDLEHTLNRLSLLGTPMRVWSDDPVRRDLFFRFNQSLQEFFNGSASVRTEFGIPQ